MIRQDRNRKPELLKKYWMFLNEELSELYSADSIVSVLDAIWDIIFEATIIDWLMWQEWTSQNLSTWYYTFFKNLFDLDVIIINSIVWQVIKSNNTKPTDYVGLWKINKGDNFAPPDFSNIVLTESSMEKILYFINIKDEPSWVLESVQRDDWADV